MYKSEFVHEAEATPSYLLRGRKVCVQKREKSYYKRGWLVANCLGRNSIVVGFLVGREFQQLSRRGAAMIARVKWSDRLAKRSIERVMARSDASAVTRRSGGGRNQRRVASPICEMVQSQWVSCAANRQLRRHRQLLSNRPNLPAANSTDNYSYVGLQRVLCELGK